VSEKCLNYQPVVGSVTVEVRYRPRELLTAAKALGEHLVEPNDRPLLDILRFWSNVIDELVIDGRPARTSMHTMTGGTLAIITSISDGLMAHATPWLAKHGGAQ